MQAWTKLDIDFVIAVLNEVKVTLINDVIFIKPTFNTADEFEMQLNTIAHTAGGAAVAVFNVADLRAAIDPLAESIADEILEYVKPGQEKIYPVVIKPGVFKEEYKNCVQFLIAHEVGHLYHDHHLVSEGLGPICADVDEKEFQADDFATEVLGTKEPAKATFTHMLQRICEARSNPDFVSQYDMLDAMTTHLSARLAHAA